MKSQALQNLIKNIFTDEDAKLKFISNPDSVVSQYKLTKQEQKAVLAAYKKMGLITADSQQFDIVVDPYGTWW